MSDLAYMIVYPRGDRSRLCVAHVYWWEESEYDIASLKRFDDYHEAHVYMGCLVKKHGLNNQSEQKLLD